MYPLSKGGSTVGRDEEVTGSKPGRNRLHIDVSVAPVDGARRPTAEAVDAEKDRLVNEFCLQ